MEFLSTLLNHDLELNYRSKAPCFFLSFKSNRSQEEHDVPPTNIFTLLRTTLIYKRPRQQQKQKKVYSDNRRENQARKPIRHETTSDWETKIEDDQHILVEAPLRISQNAQITD